MVMNGEWGWMWKVALMIYFKALYQHFPEITEENHETPQLR
jgi:hypothetical protein